MRKIISLSFRMALLLICCLSVAQLALGQTMDRIERGRMKSILNIVKKEVKNNYYDPNFHGVKLDERVQAAADKLETATTSSQSLAIIAQVLIDFNDSHLFLSPPSTNIAVDYGWKMQAIGDRCFITEVKPGSDGEAKGLAPGDQVLGVSGFTPSKKELWKVLYYYNAISKRTSLTLNILKPGAEEPIELEVKSQIKNRPRAVNFDGYFLLFNDFYNEENDKHRFVTAGDITVWRMPSFGFDPDLVDGYVDRANAEGALIIDLRDNGGGFVKTTETLVSNFFDKEIKMADLKGRKRMDPMIAKKRGKVRYPGKLVVLIDSNSGSGSEIFARVIQLEKRGVVLGDVSAGAVMQSRRFDGDVGSGDKIVPFSISITNADVIMADGNSLEHVGVIPDELILPTAEDLAARRDPVMARAFSLVGGKITPEAAGKFFKYYWRTD